MKNNYKHAASITSQITFCATPLRLDPYNHCQFGCAYCFAKTRQGYGRDSDYQIINPETLRKRLERVEQGSVNSALDELIKRRIPFQLGGMADPFGKIEEKEKKTFAVIKILSEMQYPFIVSTKSNLIARRDYLDIIRHANAYIRFSTTVVHEAIKSRIDVGCPSFEEIAGAALTLSSVGVPTAFRFQPIIPGFEDEAFKMMDVAASSGVKHITAEYLKVPLDANLNFGSGLMEQMGRKPIESYVSLGAKKQGREYILPMSYRMQFLPNIYKYAKGKGLTFGFADNDLLLHSDGAACCSAADLYLSNIGTFDANIVSLGKHKKIGEQIRFEELCATWMPHKPVSTYLNSKARINTKNANEPDWKSYLRKSWLGELGVYTPNYFDGIEKTDQIDASGMPVFRRVESSFERAIRL